MSRKYLSCADTAKLVRQSLKEAFPAVKFSVRSSVYSGGASIDVGWTDGPNEDQVKDVVSRFKGGYFDGSIDYQGTVYAMMDGEQVHFGADFIFTNRKYSDKAVEAVLARVCRRLGGLDKLPTVEDYRQGRLWNLKTSGNCDVGRELGAALHRHTYVIAQASKTAAKTFITHDDGYSRSCGSGSSAVGL